MKLLLIAILFSSCVVKQPQVSSDWYVLIRIDSVVRQGMTGPYYHKYYTWKLRSDKDFTAVEFFPHYKRNIGDSAQMITHQ